MFFFLALKIFRNERNLETKPLLEKMEGCSAGGMKGLISWLGVEIYLQSSI